MLQAIITRRVILGVARHVLTALGGALVASGYADAATTEAITGGGVALAGVLWSVLDKRP